MLRKLRIKFVALSMGLLLILLTVIITIVNIMNYDSVVSYADTIAGMLVDNRGVFPDFSELKIKENAGSKGIGELPKFSGEMPYETRYFSVLLDGGGNVVFADTGRIASVDSNEAIAYAKKIWNGEKDSGFEGDYRYAAKRDEKGCFIVFVDCGRRLESFHTFLMTSIWITLAGYSVVFVLILVLSGMVMKPFAENYEKQKRFITDAGHDLKTPLAIIGADADVLEIDVGEENEWLQDIRKQTARLTEMTNSLICLARMEETGKKPQMIDFPVSDVVAEMLQSYQALAISQGKTFETDIEPMVSMCADERGVRQLVSVLLDNAVKYAPKGGKITVMLHRTGNSLKLTVENTSKPVDQEDLKHLFDRFYRTDKSRNSETGGFGIGLSVAKAVVASHKGTIRAYIPQKGMFGILVSFPL